MMSNNINYQQIYEQEVSEVVKSSLEKPSRFYELSNYDRQFIEELIDIGYRRAVEDALDPDVMEDTANLAAEMGTQLYNFANLVQTYLQPPADEP